MAGAAELLDERRTHVAGADHENLHVNSFGLGPDTWEFEGPQGKVTVKVAPRMHSNSGDTCRAAALMHQGIILQPSFLVGDDLKSGALVQVLPEYLSIALGVYAVYPTRKHLSPKVRLLIDYLVESARQRGWPE
ncbi:MAG: LysR substrate-binding domain-containing protein [Rubrivivax sp.]